MGLCMWLVAIKNVLDLFSTKQFEFLLIATLVFELPEPAGAANQGAN